MGLEGGVGVGLGLTRVRVGVMNMDRVNLEAYGGVNVTM